MSTVRLLAGGLKSFLPFRKRYSMTAAPVSTEYGYAMWLRHIAELHERGMTGRFANVVELGPGNSVATGIAAILCGATTYVGLDALNHLAREQLVRVYDEMVALVGRRAPIPGADRLPNLLPVPKSLAFPPDLLRALDAHPQSLDAAARVLREEIGRLGAGDNATSTLRYMSPWHRNSIADASVDLVMSQAVLQEIEHDGDRSALRECFAAMFGWLRPGGVASHQIDMGMYSLEPWNIHWTWPDPLWFMVRGQRDNFVNRAPLSTYVSLARAVGFDVIAVEPRLRQGVPDRDLTARYRTLGDSDRMTSSAHLMLRKPH